MGFVLQKWIRNNRVVFKTNPEDLKLKKSMLSPIGRWDLQCLEYKRVLLVTVFRNAEIPINNLTRRKCRGRLSH